MARPTYTPPPNDPPSLGDPDFAADASGFLGWFPSFGDHIEAVVDYMESEWLTELPDGNAASPGMRFASDPDTGIFRVGGNTLGFATGATQRMQLSTASFQVNVPIVGTAAQTSASDATAGRLLKTGAMRAALGADVFGRGNILGTVTQSAGAPTGALIETGANANGRFVRFADGTQICTHAMNGDTGGAASWTYPAAFVNTTGLSASVVPVSTAVRDGQLESYSASGLTFSALTSVGGRAATLTLLTAIGRWF